MSELEVGPFAEKLQKAVEGRVFPKAPSAEEPKVADSVVRPGRESRLERSEEHQEGQGSARGSVTGEAVHRRTQFLERMSTPRESDPDQIAEVLLADITQKADVLKALDAFVRSAGFQAEGEGDLDDVIAKHLGEANEVTRSRSDTGESYTTEDVDRLRAIQVELLTELTDMRVGLEELENSREVVLSEEIKALLGTGLSISANQENESSQPVRVEPKTKKKRKNSPKPAVETESSGEIEEKVARLKVLVGRWRELERRFSPEYLRDAVQKELEVDALPILGAGRWLKSGTDPKKWNAEKRAFFVENVLRPMEEWVTRAETVSKDLREQAKRKKMTGKPAPKKLSQPVVAAGEEDVAVKPPVAQAPILAVDPTVVSDSVEGKSAAVVAPTEPATPNQSSPSAEPLTSTGDQTVNIDPVEVKPKTNVSEIRTGRPIVDIEDLTAWERSADQNQLRRELFLLKDSFVSRLEEQLRRNKNDPAECALAISQALRTFLLAKIPVVIDKIELTPSDTETLMGELMAAEPVNKS